MRASGLRPGAPCAGLFLRPASPYAEPSLSLQGPAGTVRRPSGGHLATPLHCHRSQLLRAAGAGGRPIARVGTPSPLREPESVRGRHREQNSMSKVIDAPVACLSVV